VQLQEDKEAREEVTLMEYWANWVVYGAVWLFAARVVLVNPLLTALRNKDKC
jgi:hypothetical protein